MLALATGWTQRVISGETGEVSDDFRRAAQWALYTQTVVPHLRDNEAAAATPEPQGVSALDKVKFARARLDARDTVALIRTSLFPEDDDGRS